MAAAAAEHAAAAAAAVRHILSPPRPNLSNQLSPGARDAAVAHLVAMVRTTTMEFVLLYIYLHIFALGTPQSASSAKSHTAIEFMLTCAVPMTPSLTTKGFGADTARAALELHHYSTAAAVHALLDQTNCAATQAPAAV